MYPHCGSKIPPLHHPPHCATHPFIAQDPPMRINPHAQHPKCTSPHHAHHPLCASTDQRPAPNPAPAQ